MQQESSTSIRLIRHSRDRYQIITPHTVDLGSAEKLENFLTQEINSHRNRTIELAAAKQKLRAMVASEQGEVLPEPTRVAQTAPTLPPPPTFNARAVASRRTRQHRVTVVATSTEAAPDAVSPPKSTRRRSGASYLAHLRALEQQGTQVAQG